MGKPPANVGATIELPSTGMSPAQSVTLVQVVDPAQGGEYINPDTGKRFVGVQLRIVDTKSESDMSPANNTTLVDTHGHSHSSDFNSLANCPPFATPLVVTPGNPSLGCVAFEMPVGANVAKVQYSPASGFSNATAQWRVPQ